jgi:hypothetical protein
MVMEWEAESDEPATTLGAAFGEEPGERLEASSGDLADAVGRARRARLDAANPAAVAVDEVIFEPSF